MADSEIGRLTCLLILLLWRKIRIFRFRASNPKRHFDSTDNAVLASDRALVASGSFSALSLFVTLLLESRTLVKFQHLVHCVPVARPRILCYFCDTDKKTGNFYELVAMTKGVTEVRP